MPVESSSPSRRHRTSKLARPTHTPFERSLATIGFFSPSSNRSRKSTKKVVSSTHFVNGQRHLARTTIIGTDTYGLPTTADQDTYLAILKVADDHRINGLVQRDVHFTYAQLLQMQGKAPSGKNYQELEQQLFRMMSVTIKSEDSIWQATKRAYAKEAFRVFDAVLLRGVVDKATGLVATSNFVRLSEWQLENLNAKYSFPIDYDKYRRVRNHIAKALVPILHVWLYASRKARTFAKSYDEFCQLLNIIEHKYISRIQDQLGPALDELIALDFLDCWDIQLMKDGRRYKIVFEHGRSFRDAPAIDLLLGDSLSVDRIEALTSRGIHPEAARTLLDCLAPDQDLEAQLEYHDQRVQLDKRSRARRIANPPGLLVDSIRKNLSPPDTFRSSAELSAREEADASARQERSLQRALRDAYAAYCEREASSAIAKVKEEDPDKYAAALEAKLAILIKEYPMLRRISPAQRLEQAHLGLIKDAVADVPLKYKDFRARSLDANVPAIGTHDDN